MDYNLSYVSDNHCQKWDDFLQKNDDSNVFQQFGWKEIIRKVYGPKPYYLVAEDESGTICGSLPLFLVTGLLFKKKLISVPYVPYGGICCTDDTVREKLLLETLLLVEKLKIDNLEIRSDHCQISPFDDINSPLSMYTNYSTFFLDLSKSVDQAWADIGKNKRNRVRKGESLGLKYEICNGDNDSIDEFYEVYSVNMRRLGTPVHDKRFFRAISSTFKDTMYVANVLFHNDVICSQILLGYKDILISGWGSSLPECRKFSPTNLLDWNSINFGHENGYNWLDFGRSPVNSGNYNYKMRWGAREVPLHYYYLKKKGYISNQNKYSHLSRYWSKIPLSVTKIVGPLIRGKIE
ncbi:GNAT family N-acetyltransferase [Methanosphaerula palustris]|uniref:BioF2-like acetyltransferase domain-containing protein n=1 Tax=Methanosphaerula palustris (strain ATCC BAA-1556 / DSM 19958 / E1-9c) TaxID=521011 RepID=B8GGD9_METPE|nr:GNAT family N-acetyltransferase [Methanosphaerula palustris]ACL16194.1 conserved hypothetical protein [Methanosphaerula palustris E1-9c]